MKNKFLLLMINYVICSQALANLALDEMQKRKSITCNPVAEEVSLAPKDQLAFLELFGLEKILYRDFGTDRKIFASLRHDQDQVLFKDYTHTISAMETGLIKSSRKVFILRTIEQENLAKAVGNNHFTLKNNWFTYLPEKGLFYSVIAQRKCHYNSCENYRFTVFECN